MASDFEAGKGGAAELDRVTERSPAHVLDELDDEPDGLEEPGPQLGAGQRQHARGPVVGQPVFHRFPVPKPMRVFYLQLEGSYLESKKRLRLIRESQQVSPDLPWCTPNLFWESWDANLNILKPEDSDMVMDYISSYIPLDLIIVDPIYMCVAGDLSKSEVAGGFIKFSNRLRQFFNCAVLHLHHNHRAKRDQNGKLVDEDEAFYGSQFLKAHCDVSWAMRKHLQGKDEYVLLTRHKNRNSNITSLVTLDFDPEFYTVRATEDPSELDTQLKIITTLAKLKEKGQSITTFREILSLCHVSTVSLRRFQRDTVALDYVTLDKVSGNKTIWRLK